MTKKQMQEVLQILQTILPHTIQERIIPEIQDIVYTYATSLMEKMTTIEAENEDQTAQIFDTITLEIFTQTVEKLKETNKKK